MMPFDPWSISQVRIHEGLGSGARFMKNGSLCAPFG
jgi:hypothetical protein